MIRTWQHLAGRISEGFLLTGKKTISKAWLVRMMRSWEWLRRYYRASLRCIMRGPGTMMRNWHHFVHRISVGAVLGGKSENVHTWACFVTDSHPSE